MSTNRRAQQETEKEHIKEFLRRKGIEVTVEYGDAPDAVLSIEGRRVGIEHCELTEEDLAANAPNITWIEGALRAELTKLGLGEDFSIGVGLNATAPVFRKRSQVENLVAQITRLVLEQATGMVAGTSVQINVPTLARKGFADLLCVTIIRRAGSRGGPDTIVSPAFWGPVDSSARAAVRAKERRLPIYKATKALEEVWLLLVTGESWVQATDSAMTEWLRLASTFDAVYLMDTRTGQLQRLDVHANR